MDWKETIFDNVLRLNRGFDLPNQAIEEGPYPVVASTSIKANHKAFKVEGPGVITGRSGSLGIVQYLAGRFWPLNTALYVKDFKGNNERFIAYFLQTMHLENFNSGAGVPTLNQNHLHKLTVRIPDVATQRKIAAILTAYDDLIETNKRRIALLEKLAEELYREWFVRMRFPGYQDAKFVKGVPEGWVIVRVDSLGRVVTGKTPSTKVPRYYGGNIPFIKTPDMHGNIFLTATEETLSEDGMRLQPSQTIPARSICVSCIGTGGVVSITTTTSQTNQQINSLCLTRTEDLEWSYHVLRGLKETILLFGGTGATMTNLSKGKFSGLELLSPPEGIRDGFHNIAEPIFSEVQTLAAANASLNQARDLLLPRLISGKFSVEELDIQFPPSMQEIATEPEPVYA